MIGPPLENLKHWTIDQWITAIMDPNRNVEPKYKQSSILTKDDQVFAGIVQDDLGGQIRLAQPDGTLRTLAKEDIEEIKESTISLMPDGFEEKLDPQQLSALLGFLRSR